MSQLNILKSAQSLSDVAILLNLKPASLAYILYKKNPAEKYVTFDIPKRHGGVRTICAPTKDLKRCQRRLADLLQNCVIEIFQINKWKDNVSHGFKREKSIVTNASEHRNRRYVFNIDLDNFFGTINFGRVRGLFINDKNFSLAPEVATVLAQIACHNNFLPQGSPCSPVISNLIAHILDMCLIKLASSTGCTYSRYADDLTFSTNKKDFPESIAKEINKDLDLWTVGKKLEKEITKCGFNINMQKTRMQYRNSRQEVTGLVVNKKINVRNEYRRTVRAMVNRLFTTGGFELPESTAGKIPGTLNQLRGMLGFINYIDKFNHEKNGAPKAQPDMPRNELMYRRFLIFSEFFAAPAPVIICEGKTDNVYVLHAIRSLVEKFPQLANKKADGNIDLKIRIYKYSETSTGRILGIQGGTGELKKFISTYNKEIKKFKATGALRPVIILVDNDEGAKDIYWAVKDITKKKPTGIEPFVHITSNLYLVATPIKNEGELSSIEDLFDESIKGTLIEGKKFVCEENFDTSTCYGKTIFAHKVVKPNADKIDFSGFAPLLTKIAAVVDYHTSKYPTE